MPAEDLKILPLDPGPLVLVVDDEARPRSIITRMVGALGYQARSCHSGRAALRFLKDHPREVRLLLADLGCRGWTSGSSPSGRRISTRAS